MISHAQNFEDVILWRALKSVGNGSYVDIGAHDPVADSISLSFYEKGWRGVHVEPAPIYAQMLREARPDEVVIEAAVGADPRPLTFWVFPGTGLSTGDPEIAAGHQAAARESIRMEVPCIPLSRILDEHGAKRPIHWLKIDVEGMEQSVIESWAPSTVRPWIVLVESTRPGTTESAYESWEPDLLKLGYEFVYFDGLNRFYVSAEKAELKSTFGPGANIFDGFLLDQSSIFNQRLNADLVWRNNEIQRLNNDLAASVSLSNDRASALVAATSAWEVAASAFERQVASARYENEGLQAALTQRDAEMDRVRSAADSARQALAGRDAELGATHAAYASVQAELTALRASTSWRISAPVRWIGQALKKALRAGATRTAPPAPPSPVPPSGPSLAQAPAAAVAPPPAGAPAAPTVEDPSAPLSLRARQIFADLKSPEP